MSLNKSIKKKESVPFDLYSLDKRMIISPKKNSHLSKEMEKKADVISTQKREIDITRTKKHKKINTNSLDEENYSLNPSFQSSNENSNSFISKNFSSTISPKDSFKTLPSQISNTLASKMDSTIDLEDPLYNNSEISQNISEYMNLNNILKKVTSKDKIYDPVCIRKRSNIANYTRNNFDKNRDPNQLYDNLLKAVDYDNYSSPKIQTLINKIKELDENDLKQHGTLYKHFIFTNLKSKNYGINVISNELMKHKWKLGFYGIPLSVNDSSTINQSKNGGKMKDKTNIFLDNENNTPNSILNLDLNNNSLYYPDKKTTNILSLPKENLQSSSKSVIKNSLLTVSPEKQISPSLNKMVNVEQLYSSDNNANISLKEKSQQQQQQQLKSKKGENIFLSNIRKNTFKKGNAKKPLEAAAIFKGIDFLSDEELLKNKFYNFYVMSSQSLFDKTFDKKIKHEILSRFNSRPDNNYGEKIRIIITDNGFREGIDIFDIKYIHIFEPPETLSDLKQAIGRGTRTCGQSGLPFDPENGWLLHVYIYDIVMPRLLKPFLKGSTSAFDFFMNAKNNDINNYNLITILENTLIENAVDKDLTMPLTIKKNKSKSESESETIRDRRLAIKDKYYPPKEKMDHKQLKEYISNEYSDFKWITPKIQNECIKSSESRVFDLTMSQQFISNYFTPESYNRGILLWHTVGSGKCHSFNTPILMYDGSIKMVQNVVVGDILMGDDSTERKVLSLANGIDDMYDICYEDGIKYGVNSEHILVLHIDINDFNAFKDFFGNIKLDKDGLIEIELKEFLKLPFSLRNKCKGIRKYVDFPYKEVQIDPYLYGLWIISKDMIKYNTYENDYEFKIKNEHIKILDYIKSVINNLYESNNFTLYKDEYGSYTYIIKNNNINTFSLPYLSNINKNIHSNNINNYNKLPLHNSRKYHDLDGNPLTKKIDNKISLTMNQLKIESQYKINSRNIRLKLLAGIIDMCYINKLCILNEKKLGIIISFKRLKKDIIFLAQSLGFSVKNYNITCGTYNNIIKYMIEIDGNKLEEIPSKYFNNSSLMYFNSIHNTLNLDIKVEYIGKDKYYGFTISGNGRYILGDFTVTHNTCTAIATASKSFEENNYTILWVTKTTLRDDIWKNIYDRSCHIKLRKIIEKDNDVKLNKSYLSKSWAINPISYKQFTNLIEKKNKIYDRLVKINGLEDPLRKTLVIIDEAHKLYGNSDLSTLEKPNMKMFHEALMNSYIKNGKNSVKVMLMTATPIKDNPMEIIQLINLLKLPEEQMPSEINYFKEKYLTKDMMFTEYGKKLFCDETAGLVSYLNLSTVIGKFAQPIIHQVYVPSINDEELLNVDVNFTKQYYNEIMKNNKKNIDILNFQKNNIPLFAGKLNQYKNYYCEEKRPLEKRLCGKIIKSYIDQIKIKMKEKKNEIDDTIKYIKKRNDRITLKRNKHINIIKDRSKILPRSMRDIPKQLPDINEIMNVKNIKLKKQLLLMRKFYDNPLYSIYKKCSENPNNTEKILDYYKNNINLNDDEFLIMKKEIDKIDSELFEERKQFTKNRNKMSQQQKERYKSKIYDKAMLLKDKKNTYKLKVKEIKDITKPIMKENIKTLKYKIKDQIANKMLEKNINQLEDELKNINIECPEGKILNPETGRCVKIKAASKF